MKRTAVLRPQQPNVRWTLELADNGVASLAIAYAGRARGQKVLADAMLCSGSKSEAGVGELGRLESLRR